LLEEKIGTNNLVLSTRQELNEKAVRLAKVDDPLICAYLYTYGQDEGKCGVHLEFPQYAESDISSSMDVYENVGIELLADMLAVHFDLTPSL
jgi:hypothetical protein